MATIANPNFILYVIDHLKPYVLSWKITWDDGTSTTNISTTVMIIGIVVAVLFVSIITFGLYWTLCRATSRNSKS